MLLSYFLIVSKEGIKDRDTCHPVMVRRFIQLTAYARAPLKPHTLYLDQPHMLRKTLRKGLVCWMHKVPRGAIADAEIIRPDAEVAIRENENPSLNGRCPLRSMVRFYSVIGKNARSIWSSPLIKCRRWTVPFGVGEHGRKRAQRSGRNVYPNGRCSVRSSI